MYFIQFYLCICFRNISRQTSSYWILESHRHSEKLWGVYPGGGQDKAAGGLGLGLGEGGRSRFKEDDKETMHAGVHESQSG